MKKLIFIILSVVMLSALLLVGCNNEDTSTVMKDYKVTVKDNAGNAYKNGIVVRFLKNGEQVALQPCDENGVAVKSLTAGDYTVELAFTEDEKGYYYEKNIALSAEKNEAEVILSKRITSAAQKLYSGGDEFDVYDLSLGCTYVELAADYRNYFLFTPTEAGNYSFSIVGESNAVIGYYGAPHYVQSESVAEVKDNMFTVSVSASMIGSGDTGTATYVIGVDANGAQSCVIGIQRIGDPIKTLEDEPWTIYQKTHELEAYQLPDGYTIKEFDLTASSDTYNLVLNSEDGFYHLGSENGPLVLVRLTEDCDYIACFKTILDRSGVSKYFFDENGEFVKKESYSECLLEYIEYADEAEGVYPLTEDLKYIIQQRGDYVGWWNPESAGYLFKDENGYALPDINNEIAWLLMCCYTE